MQIDVRAGDVLTEPSDLAVLALTEGSDLPPGVGELIEPTDVPVKPNKVMTVYPRGAIAPTRLMLLGLGSAESLDHERIRQAAATAIRSARELQQASITLGFAAPIGLDPTLLGEALAEGLELGAYRYLQHKTKLSDEERFEVASVTILVDAGLETEIAAGVTTGRAVSAGTLLARELVNRPPELKTPPLLADAAVEAFAGIDGVSVTVFDEQRLAAEGFGGIIAVGKGSDAPPRFIIVEYGAGLEGVPTVCLVGKGLTFDTGGYNIKPETGMLTMKSDMGGSAAVFGAVHAAATLQLPVHIVGLVPSAENMISGRAFRPSDVITSLSGTTMEILNTDAEGRVILSDGLFYAQRYEPDAIISVATLTGAVIVALGDTITGVMATDQGLADAMVAAGTASGDRAWQLPLWDEHREMIKADVGDIKNLAGRAAGSITAAAFLAEFVGDHAYAHLDIAGTAWRDTASKPYETKGGTGAGVRLLSRYLRDISG